MSRITVMLAVAFCTAYVIVGVIALALVAIGATA